VILNSLDLQLDSLFMRVQDDPYLASALRPLASGELLVTPREWRLGMKAGSDL